MRIDVKKYLIFGPSSMQDLFFAKVQELGIAEFISSRPESLEHPQEIQIYLEALHVLRTRIPVKQVIPFDYRSAIVFARHLVEQNEELEKMREQVRILEQEIARVEVFGEFSIPELELTQKMANYTFQFFFAKKIENLEAIKHEEVIYIGTLYDLHYFMSINKERVYYEGLIEMKIERSIGELKEELATILRKIDVIEDELAELAHHQKELKQGLSDAFNHYHLDQSRNRADGYLDGGLFAVEAWVPKNKSHLLDKLSSQIDISCELIGFEKKDRVPTYLENKSFGRLGEDLVSIYDTPSKQDRDPSWWVFFSFGLFFSMIIADAGYGIILCGIALYLWYKFGKKGGLALRTIKLTFWLSIGCVIWGAMLPSFLGIEFEPESKWRDVSLITWMVKKKAEYVMDHKDKTYQGLTKEYPQLKNAKTPMQFLTMVTKKQEHATVYTIFHDFQDNVLIELSIFIGTIHLIISLLRYLDRNWAAIGWVTFMVGGYLYFPTIVKALSIINYIFYIPPVGGAAVGIILIWIGLGLVVVLAIAQKRLAGVGDIMHVIQLFADVMSYLRIYALSLAGIIMASTFDQIGISVPIYAGIFIILIGHTVNLTLAIMGGVIHGLRLNFIEWYHYSFEGGGRLFRPLSLIKID